MLTLSDILIRTYGNQTEAARLLGVHRNTITSIYKEKRLNAVIEVDGELRLLIEPRIKSGKRIERN